MRPYVLLCYDDYRDLTKVGLGRFVLLCYDSYDEYITFELELKSILQRWEVYKLGKFTPGVKMAYAIFTLIMRCVWGEEGGGVKMGWRG